MITQNYNSGINFRAIKILPGGQEYVEKEGGLKALTLLHNSIPQFHDSKWKLSVDGDGYALTSPTTQKTYRGPFSVKKLFKTGGNRKKTSQLVIRMNETNRVKYPVLLSSTTEVRNIYSKIRKTNGIELMVMLLALLEGKV